MTAHSAIDAAAQIIADARVECLKIDVSPKDIAKIMLDKAVLAFMVTGMNITGIDKVLKKYTKHEMPAFATAIRQQALKVAANIKVH